MGRRCHIAISAIGIIITVLLTRNLVTSLVLRQPTAFPASPSPFSVGAGWRSNCFQFEPLCPAYFFGRASSNFVRTPAHELAILLLGSVAPGMVANPAVFT